MPFLVNRWLSFINPTVCSNINQINSKTLLEDKEMHYKMMLSLFPKMQYCPKINYIKKVKEDETEEGNPEAGANPKKKKVEEGITLVKGFAQFVNEEHGGYHDYGSFDEEEYMQDEDDHNHEDDDSCETCGEVPISNEYGYSCGCNM